MKTELARSGEPVLTYKGRYLASSVDPRAEADKWCANQTVLPNLEVVIVLGVGSGYHLVSLERRFPHMKFIAADFQSEAVEFTGRQHDFELRRTKLLHLKSSDEIYGSITLKHAVSKRYTVIAHSVTRIYGNGEFQTAQDLLCGRTIEGFRWICESRQWSTMFAQAGHLLPMPSRGVLSIHELMKSMIVDAPGFEDQISTLKALRELVV